MEELQGSVNCASIFDAEQKVNKVLVQLLNEIVSITRKNHVISLMDDVNSGKLAKFLDFHSQLTDGVANVRERSATQMRAELAAKVKLQVSVSQFLISVGITKLDA